MDRMEGIDCSGCPQARPMDNARPGVMDCAVDRDPSECLRYDADDHLEGALETALVDALATIAAGRKKHGVMHTLNHGNYGYSIRRLMSEVGEVADAADTGDLAHLRRECLDAAAVSLSLAASIDAGTAGRVL